MQSKEPKNKRCIVCDVLLDRSNTTWYRQKNYIHKCHGCTRIEKRDWARKNRERDPKIQAERSHRHNKKLKKERPVTYTARQMCGSARKRSRALGIAYDINSTYVESISPKTCPVFGFSLKYGGGGKTRCSASLDRIDPEGGYVRGNVRVMSSLANTMKSDATMGELRAFAGWIVKNERV